eukprot:COSAG06_NODE_21565_length_752_cov_32.431853_1_plen_36_part_10
MLQMAGKYQTLAAQDSDTCIDCVAGKYQTLSAQDSD